MTDVVNIVFLTDVMNIVYPYVQVCLDSLFS
jgi:hypothetical protein